MGRLGRRDIGLGAVAVIDIYAHRGLRDHRDGTATLVLVLAPGDFVWRRRLDWDGWVIYTNDGKLWHRWSAAEETTNFSSPRPDNSDG
jgi:hypothetical protein